MNFNLLIDISLVFFAIWVQLKGKKEKAVVFSFYFIFLASYVLNFYFQGFYVALNYADLTSCLLLTILLGYLYFQFNQESLVPFWKSPEKLITMGMLIYFACSVPFIALWDYLSETAPRILGYLYYGINTTIAFTRYLFAGLAFWLIYKQNKQKTLST